MSSIDLISMAVRNLFKRKLRTFLTILGVVVGTAAIVVMVSLGIALDESYAESIAQWGDIRTITVYSPNEYYYFDDDNSNNKDLKLDETAINTFKEIKGVSTATGFIDLDMRMISGKYSAWQSVRGIDPEAMEELGFSVSDGRLLESGDKYNVVFGIDTPYYFRNANSRRYEYLSRYNGDDPKVDVLTARIQMHFDYSFGNSDYTPSIKPYTVKGVGILEEKDYQSNYYVYMDIKEAEKIKIAQINYENQLYGNTGTRQNKFTGYSQAYVKCVDIDAVRYVEEIIREMGYNCSSATNELDYAKETSQGIQTLLGSIGAVSLFVAAIGITNTMVMSIYERTREIGVMKVIGAAIKDIKKLFLIEAALIGFFGGVFGVILSLIASKILNTAGVSFLGMVGGGGGSKVSSIPSWLCMSALIFSAAIGLFAGYFPARRATKLSALSAIRTE